MTSDDINRIKRSQQNAAPHVRQRQTWKDTEALIAEVERLAGIVAKWKGVLQFYADPSRYDYDETCCPSKDNPGYKTFGGGVLSDCGDKAQEALSAEKSEASQ